MLPYITGYLLIGLTFQWLVDKYTYKPLLEEFGGWSPGMFFIMVFLWPIPVATAIYAVFMEVEDDEDPFY